MNTNVNQNDDASAANTEYEIIHLEKTKKVCSLCETYAASKVSMDELTAVMSCEGACLRGEISRRVANKICFEDSKDNIVRICLGGAFTKDTGQRGMVRSAKRVIALEGCFIECASRMMRSVISDLKVDIITVDNYYSFNAKLFSIDDVSEEELLKYSCEAAENIKAVLNL